MSVPSRRAPVGLALAFTACIVAWQPAHADPQISIKTKLAEITVEVEDALKPYPGLVDNLLAEGRKWATQMRADAEKEKKESPESFADGRKWSLERMYSSRSVVGRYVSVVRVDSTYQGGAHPNQNIDTILWDAQAKKRISIRPFFKETADNGQTMTALAKLVQLAVVVEKAVRFASQESDKKDKKEPAQSPEDLLKDDADVSNRIQPSLLKIGPVTLAPSTVKGKSSGLTFHFSPYDVDAYAAGPYTVFVAWEKFKPYLSAEGAAIFGGERPETDAKEN
jgi:hypothetical protein